MAHAFVSFYRRLPFLTSLVVVSLIGLILPGGESFGREAVTRRLVTQTDSPGEATLVLELPFLDWRRAGGRVYPVMPGFGSLSQPAQPDLPARRERVALTPTGSFKLLGVEVEWYEGIIPGELAAYPGALGQPAAPRGEPGFWPEDVVRPVITQGAFRTLRFATLEIRPVQIDMESGRFRVARRVRIRFYRGLSQQTQLASRVKQEPRLLDRLDAASALGADQVGRLEPGPHAPSAPTAPAAATQTSFPAWQFEVDRDGIYRVSYTWAQNNDPDLLAFLTANDPRRYRLTCQGLELPIFVLGEGDGSFDPPGTGRPEGDAIIFYGQFLDTDIMDPDIWQKGDYTDANVYTLDIASGASRISERQGAPEGVFPVPGSFPETVHQENDVRFQGFVPADDVDHWYDYPYLNTDAGITSMDVFVPTPGHTSGLVSLRARLMGFRYDNNLHRTEIHVDDALVDGCGDGDNGCVDWDGHIEFTHGVDQGPVEFTTTLTPSTKVTISIPLGRGVDKDQVAVNWVELDYDRLYQAQSDQLLFTAENANHEIHVDGFSAAPEVWETSETTISDAGMELSQPRRITGGTFSGGELRFQIGPDGTLPSTRRFAAAAEGGMLTPAKVREDRPPSDTDASLGSSLKDPGQGADWIVIGPQELLVDPSSGLLGPELQSLVSYRQGQGLVTAVIDVQDIYDEFSYGIADPEGIKAFLTYALGGSPSGCSPAWDPAPSFVILAGDGSWDHKNNYGYTPPSQRVPTYMFAISENTQFGHYPSDTWFAAVCGEDELPDADVGRIPAHSFTEAEEVFRKIHDYELTSYPSAVTAKALLISEYEGGALGPFFRVHDEIYDDWFTSGPPTQSGQKLYENGTAQGDAAEVNSRIDLAVNDGAGIMSFAGHGGYKNWGKGFSIFRTEPPASTDKDDLEDILEDTPLLFTVQANCITGNFAAVSSPGSTNDISYAYLEDWLLTARKGVVAGLAPTHLTAAYELDQILDPVYEEIFSRTKERNVWAIDMRLRRDFDTYNKLVNLRSYALMGDPATYLTVPAPAKPTITSIDQAGSHALRINWTAPSDPEIHHFRIFRSTSPTSSYTQVGETADASTFTYLDTGVANCREYFYYVVSVDAEGFESRWSNFNDTCSGDRSDCESGTAEDPDPPPAPEIQSVTDLEQGGRLQVYWTKLSDPDIVEYHVVYGTSPGQYTGERTTGASHDNLVIAGLDDGVRYYVAVKAAHCSQIGPPSGELDAVPHLVQGINPARSIADLMVYRSGDDLRLDWSLPTTSVWDTDVTLTGVEVHGSSATPAFPADGSERLADLPETASSWTHAGEGAGGADRWFYLVVTRDADGTVSSANVELPAAVEDLRLRAPAGNQLELTWSRVDRTMRVAPTMDDWPLHVTGYNLYGRPSVLPRTECGAANLIQPDIPDEPAGSTSRSVTIAMPAETFFTYQLLAEETHGSESVW